MEKRYCKRIPIVMDVLLYHNNIPVVSCKTHDIGKDGLFVEAGPLAYGKDAILKVEFHTDPEDDNTSLLLPAMIIHKSKKGLGLMLPGGDSEAMKAWRHKVTKNATEN
ncbi:PilZ domain-containing protein, partial [Kaarinaea lacus]